MPGWDVTVRPAKEGLLLLCLYHAGHHGVGGRGSGGQGCVQRDAGRCDRGSGWDGRLHDRGSGQDGEDRDPTDRRGP